jgi:hypothetical protein
MAGVRKVRFLSSGETQEIPLMFSCPSSKKQRYRKRMTRRLDSGEASHFQLLVSRFPAIQPQGIVTGGRKIRAQKPFKQNLYIIMNKIAVINYKSVFCV